MAGAASLTICNFRILYVTRRKQIPATDVTCVIREALMLTGDKVTHPDYPGYQGVIDRIVFVRSREYYRVVWPWRASPGPIIMYPVKNTLLKKV